MLTAQQVGRFELRDFLGRGAIGDVYLAWDPQAQAGGGAQGGAHPPRRPGDAAGGEERRRPPGAALARGAAGGGGLRVGGGRRLLLGGHGVRGRHRPLAAARPRPAPRGQGRPRSPASSATCWRPATTSRPRSAGARSTASSTATSSRRTSASRTTTACGCSTSASPSTCRRPGKLHRQPVRQPPLHAARAARPRRRRPPLGPLGGRGRALHDGRRLTRRSTARTPRRSRGRSAAASPRRRCRADVSPALSRIIRPQPRVPGRPPLPDGGRDEGGPRGLDGRRAAAEREAAPRRRGGGSERHAPDHPPLDDSGIVPELGDPAHRRLGRRPGDAALDATRRTGELPPPLPVAARPCLSAVRRAGGAAARAAADAAPALRAPRRRARLPARGLAARSPRRSGCAARRRRSGTTSRPDLAPISTTSGTATAGSAPFSLSRARGSATCARSCGDALLKSADRILNSYHGDDPTTTEKGWQKAHDQLEAAVDLNYRDRPTRAKLVYAAGAPRPHRRPGAARATARRTRRGRSSATPSTEFQDAAKLRSRLAGSLPGPGARLLLRAAFDLEAAREGARRARASAATRWAAARRRCSPTASA